MKASPVKDLFPMEPAGIERLPEIRLEVTGLDHVPSFKNSKMILGMFPVSKEQAEKMGWTSDSRLWKGRPFIATNGDYKKVMEQITLSFLSQLFSAIQTTADATLTEQQAHSLIAWLMPQDDSRQWMPQQSIICEQVEPGQEGATIIIKRL